MDELAALAEMRRQVRADAGDYPAARQALLGEIAGRTPTVRRRGVPKTVLLSGLLAGAVAASTVVAATTLGSGNSRHAPPAAVASPTVRLVAVTSPMTLAFNAAALAQGSRTPQPTQWIYTKVVTTTSNAKPSGMQAQNPGTHRVKEGWARVDFLKFAHFQNGRLVVDSGMPAHVWGWPANLDYSYLQSLPTDPDRLLATIGHNLAALNAPSTDGQVFDTVVALMENYTVLPAKLNAALYGALARVKSVHLGHVTDLAGRQVLSLYHTDSGISTAILIDPDTYAYAGQQRVVVRDSSASGVDGTLKLRNGELLDDEAVLASKIVNSAGER